MPKPKPQPGSPALDPRRMKDESPSPEWWAPVQVAAFLQMSYQDARNAMLEGRFGESQYDAKTRRLTVLASRVRDAKKAKRTRSRRKRSRSTRHR